MHFYGWKRGLKTGMYYLRTKPAAQAIQFTVDQSILNDAKVQNANAKTTKAPAVVNGTPAVSTLALNPDSSVTSPALSSSSSREQSPATPLTPARRLDPEATITLRNAGSVGVVQYLPPTAPPAGEEDAEAMLARMAVEDPEFEAALKKLKERELEEERMYCALENKEDCLMCSG
jgi:ribonucleoside-diphosphate reductase subunit M1